MGDVGRSRRDARPLTSKVIAAVVAFLVASCSSHEEAGGPTVTIATDREARAADPGYVPKLTAADCPDPALSIDDPTVPGRVTCEVLVLPENRAVPEGRQVELPVVRWRPEQEGAGSVPVVVLHGGPGGSAVENWVLWTVTLEEPDRELVLYDQRGGGRANPRLDCPEHTDAVLAALSTADPPEAERAAVGAALRTCHERLKSSGVALDAYDTPTSTQDLEDLRTALAAEQLTLVASSYGTRLALDYLRTHPERVHSLVLDGVDPPAGTAGGTGSDPAPLADAAVERLLGACARDAGCAAKHPTLRRSLTDTLDEFDRSPREVSSDGADGTARTLLVTGDDLYAGLFSAMYDTTAMPLLPWLVDTIAADDGQTLSAVASRILQSLTGAAVGAQMSIECADHGALAPGAAGRASTLRLLTAATYCDDWPVERVPASFARPVAIDDPPPVLVITGELDPITPAVDGRRTAEQLDGVLVELAAAGHAPMLDDECGSSILRSFLARPEAPDLSCVDARTPPPFN